MIKKQINAPIDSGNAEYIEGLYEAFLLDPNSVEEKWRRYFEQLPRVSEQSQIDVSPSEVKEYFFRLTRHAKQGSSSQKINSTLQHEKKQIKVLQLINGYRFSGHLHAQLDPLSVEREIRQQDALTLAAFDLTESDLDTEFNTGSLVIAEKASLRNIIKLLKATYCDTIGVEYMHILNNNEKRWIQNRIEHIQGKPTLSLRSKKWLLKKLTAAEGIEKYLHAKYVGQKRFSLEGSESFIPMLSEIIERGGEQGIKEMVFGMAHRGRLNVLINIFGKQPKKLFREFEGTSENVSALGDVKYHQGFSSDVNTSGGQVHLALCFNPSHLEIVGPVVEGSVRARQDLNKDSAGDKVMGINIHGDSAFAGQGVVMETLNMSQTRGFSTKGTLHIIINNQIGFTTSVQQDARSTMYCSDVAKMINMPIFHVNADDPEAVYFVTHLAMDYRREFKKDVVIDLVCYRRHGHNEADEPAATQPIMYEKIRKLATTRALYAQKMQDASIIDAAYSAELQKEFRAKLDIGENVVSNIVSVKDKKRAGTKASWEKYKATNWLTDVDTRIDYNVMRALARKLLKIPAGIVMHPRVQKIMDDREKMTAGALPIDWGYAETLSYATLLYQGFSIRLSGQDSGRGTFFHRHAVIHNQNRRETYVPLRNVSKKENFLVIDSVLSEEAVLAFEYGYASVTPKTLTIWEGQFGDFANGAQVVIDQFISSGEEKWGRMSGLTLLLPHGYEGMGPEHSSARLERFLQLCANHNMQVCNPTTPAQIFHLLRRQMIRAYRKPLIIMSPKSLLRHKSAVSTLEDLAEGAFLTVLEEQEKSDPKKVDRVVMCSGKVYYELLEKKQEAGLDNVALLRIEQLHPFPNDRMGRRLIQYEHVKTFYWCQEEPINQGAWYSIQHNLRNVIDNRSLECACRDASASPATGYAKVHKEQQQNLIKIALGCSD